MNRYTMWTSLGSWGPKWSVGIALQAQEYQEHVCCRRTNLRKDLLLIETKLGYQVLLCIL